MCDLKVIPKLLLNILSTLGPTLTLCMYVCVPSTKGKQNKRSECNFLHLYMFISIQEISYYDEMCYHYFRSYINCYIYNALTQLKKPSFLPLVYLTETILYYK